jgi:hypothetical protein
LSTQTSPGYIKALNLENKAVKLDKEDIYGDADHSEARCVFALLIVVSQSLL